jgi:hypothetical protein
MQATERDSQVQVKREGQSSQEWVTQPPINVTDFDLIALTVRPETSAVSYQDHHLGQPRSQD